MLVPGIHALARRAVCAWMRLTNGIYSSVMRGQPYVAVKILDEVDLHGSSTMLGKMESTYEKRGHLLTMSSHESGFCKSSDVRRTASRC